MAQDSNGGGAKTKKEKATQSLASKYGKVASIAQTAKDTAQKKQTVVNKTTTSAGKVVTNAKPATTSSSTSSSSSYKAGTNVANEKAYLNSLIAKGGGTAEWAKSQMKELDNYEASQPKSTTSSYAPSSTAKVTTSIGSSGSSYAPTSGSKTPLASNSKTSTAERYPSVSNMAAQSKTINSGASYRNQPAPTFGMSMPSTVSLATNLAKQQGAAQTSSPTAPMLGQSTGMPSVPQQMPSLGGATNVTDFLRTQAQQTGANNAVATQADVISGASPSVGSTPYAPGQSTNNWGYTPTGGGAVASGTGTPTVGTPQQQQPQQQPQAIGQMPTWNMQQPQQQVQQSAMNVGTVFDQIANIGNQYAGQSDEHAAAVAAQYTQMVDLLDQLEAQITGQIRSQMNGDDPGLQAAIGVIKEEAARLRDESLEELNARGLVQSGVYAEALDRLGRNELTSIQQTIAGQFSDLQTQLNNSLMALAQARIGALSGNQNALNNMLISDRQTQANIGLQGIGYGLEESGQKQQWNIANMQNATNLYGMNLGAYTDIYKTNSNNNLEGRSLDLQQQQINNNYAVGMANAKSGGSGSSAAMMNYQLDRDMFDYNKTQQQQAQIEGYYQQMQTELQSLTANNQYTPEQKKAMISNSRYPDEVKQWALNQLNVIYPATQQQNTNSPATANRNTNLRDLYAPTTSFYGSGGVR